MPNYTWVCGACTTSNPPGHDDCIACHCPAASSQQLRQQYRAGFEGVGPPVAPPVRRAMPEEPREPRRPIFKPGTLWYLACFALMGAWTLSLILLWGGGPLIPGAGAPTASRWYWSLPGKVQVASLLTLLAGPPAILLCGVRALRARRASSMARALVWASLLVLAALLVMCSG